MRFEDALRVIRTGGSIYHPDGANIHAERLSGLYVPAWLLLSDEWHVSEWRSSSTSSSATPTDPEIAMPFSKFDELMTVVHRLDEHITAQEADDADVSEFMGQTNARLTALERNVRRLLSWATLE